MKSITIIATFQAKPGQEAVLKTALAALLPPTRRESGCLLYNLHVAPDDPARFLFYENWASQPHLDAHLKSPHLTALLNRVEELCAAAPQIQLWQRVGE